MQAAVRCVVNNSETSMKISIISSSPKSLLDIGAMLEQENSARVVTRHEVSINMIGALADSEHPDIFILEGVGLDAKELAPIEFVTTHYPHIFIILLSSQQNSELLINAMRVGIREVLPLPLTQTVLEAAIARAESKIDGKNTSSKAQVIAFISCKGGSGATFLAANIGHQLGEEGKKVLLIDLNMQFGEAVLTVYDRKPMSDIVQVTRNLSRLDARFLDASVTHITPHFAVLAAPDDLTQSQEVKPIHLDSILNLAINQYDFVLLDLRRHLDDLTIKALDRADKIFLVVQTLMPYVHNAIRMMAVFRSLGYSSEKIEVLVNRFWKNDEIGLNELRTSMGINKLRTIPNGYKDVAKAINLGVPLASISTSNLVFKAICEITESLHPKAQEVQTSLISRLLKH